MRSLPFIRVISLSLIFVVAVAAAQEPPNAANESQKTALEIGNQNEPPRPVSKYRGLKIAFGILGGVAVFGAIIAIAVTNSSSNNQTGYNDWGTLVIMRR